MVWDDETIRCIYDETGGYCRYCEKKVHLVNYGRSGEIAAWEVEHSIPLSRGGTDHRNNLFPACISCNRSKGVMTGTEFLRTFEEPSTPAGNPWEDALVGIAALAFLGWLSKNRR